MILAGRKIFHYLSCFVEIETVPTRLRHSNVEPYRRVEARLLGQHQMCQIHPEVLNVFFCRKVVAVPTPVRNGIDDAMNELRYARLAFRSANPPMKVLAGNNVRCCLRPLGWNFNIPLLKYDGAFVAADRGISEFPRDEIVWGFVGL